MEASRPQPMFESMSRFLAAHGSCGRGFEVAGPQGASGGGVSVVCRGCGARHRHATASIEIEREVRIDRVPGWRQAAAPGSAPAPAPPPPAVGPAPTAPPPAVEHPGPARGGREPAAAPASSSTPSRTDTHRGRAGLGVLALLAAGCAAAALLLGGGDSGERALRPAGTGPGLPPPASTNPLRPRPTPTLRTASYTVPIPPPWTRREAAGGLLLEPRGANPVARVQIFSRPWPGLDRGEMIRLTRSLLRGRNPGATISAAHPAPVPRGSAFAMSARAGQGAESALAILRGGQRYLVIRTVGDGASPSRQRQALQIERGFEPR